MRSSEAHDTLFDLTVGMPFDVLTMASEIQIKLNEGQKEHLLIGEYLTEKSQVIESGLGLLFSESAKMNYLQDTANALNKAVTRFKRVNSGHTGLTRVLTDNILRNLSGFAQDKVNELKGKTEPKNQIDMVEEKIFDGKLSNKQIAYLFHHLLNVYPEINKTNLGEGLGIIFSKSGGRIRQHLSNPDDLTDKEIISAVTFLEIWMEKIKPKNIVT